MAVVSVLLSLMDQLHQCMGRQSDKTFVSQPQIFFVLFNRFMVLVGFATAFRAIVCLGVKIFHIKIGFVEPQFPKSVGLGI